jgi:hypothetical protein
MIDARITRCGPQPGKQRDQLETALPARRRAQDRRAVGQMVGRQLNWFAGLTFGKDPTRAGWLLAYNGVGFALTSGGATLDDLVDNNTGKGTPWTRW